jgi:hypothetical protein
MFSPGACHGLQKRPRSLLSESYEAGKDAEQRFAERTVPLRKNLIRDNTYDVLLDALELEARAARSARGLSPELGRIYGLLVEDDMIRLRDGTTLKVPQGEIWLQHGKYDGVGGGDCRVCRFRTTERGYEYLGEHSLRWRAVKPGGQPLCTKPPPGSWLGEKDWGD